MQRGFTLIELMVVISIIAIAASLAIPKIGNWTASQDLDMAARELAADVRLVQQMTINSGGDAFPSMKFKNASPYGYYTYRNGTVIKPARDFPATLKTSGNPSDVTFKLDGTPATGSTMTITISRTDNMGSRSIILEAQTGRVQIQ